MSGSGLFPHPQGADRKAVYRAGLQSLWGGVCRRDEPSQRIQRSREHPAQVARAGEDTAVLRISVASADSCCPATPGLVWVLIQESLL